MSGTTGTWVYQGRQDKGWFGHGTAPRTAKDSASADAGTLFAPASIGQRIDYAANSVIGHVDPKDRGRWEASLGQGGRDGLKTAVAAWYGAAGLSRDAFRARFLDPYTSDETVDHLRAAAAGMVEARTPAELGAAGAALASAVTAVGVERWPRYLGDANARAVAAASAGHAPIVLAQTSTPNTATDASPGGNTVASSGAGGGYVAQNPEQWAGRPPVGDGECVALARTASGAPLSSTWRPGAQVQGNTSLRPGTIIATFDKDGHYTGHTAIYLGQDEHGIRVIDQWNIRDQHGRITGHKLPGERILPLGDPRHAPIDRGEFYYVVQ